MLNSVLVAGSIALAAGEDLWREPDDDPAGAPAGHLEAPPSGPVYVLTDAGCASACLDAVYLWTSLGAVQAG